MLFVILPFYLATMRNVTAHLVPLAPPPYEPHRAASTATSDVLPLKLPSYVEATTLPTYDEAESTKKEKTLRPSTDDVLFIKTGQNQDDTTIGTDKTFICTFIISFWFNWFGYILSIQCLSKTVAGHSGALSGVGFSIVFWVYTIKYSVPWICVNISEETWLWWLLFFCGLCGFLMFIRGAVQYIIAKSK